MEDGKKTHKEITPEEDEEEEDKKTASIQRSGVMKPHPDSPG